MAETLQKVADPATAAIVATIVGALVEIIKTFWGSRKTAKAKAKVNKE